jgi:hypothetical protein
MSGLVRRNFDSPEETRPFEGGTGYVQLVKLLRDRKGPEPQQPRPFMD